MYNFDMKLIFRQSAHVLNMYFSGDGDHPTYEDAEYSDEIALAYEQFLKDSEQHTQKR